MRYRNLRIVLLILYCGIHGVSLIGGLSMWVAGELAENVALADVGSYVVVGGGLCTLGVLAAFLRRDQLGPVLAFAHSLVLIVFSLFMFHSIQLDYDERFQERWNRGLRETKVSIIKPGHWITLGIHALVAVTAAATFFASDWRKPPEKASEPGEGAGEALFNVLAFAVSADGVPSREKMQLACNAWKSFSADSTLDSVLSKRFLVRQQLVNREAMLVRSAKALRVLFSPEQKKWLLNQTASICSAVQGEMDLMSQTFLEQLAIRLGVKPHA